MKKTLFMLATAGFLSLSWGANLYVHAEEDTTENQSNLQSEQQASEFEQWISDEPSSGESDEASYPDDANYPNEEDNQQE